MTRSCPHCGKPILATARQQHMADTILKMQANGKTRKQMGAALGVGATAISVFVGRFLPEVKFSRGGNRVNVPAHLLEDYKTLKRSGYSRAEALAALGVPVQ